jgi:prepilin-type N-terminal cleavage/methylation domain-containing protein
MNADVEMNIRRSTVSPRLCRGVGVQGGSDQFAADEFAIVAQSTPRQSRGLTGRGFTLVEMMVVIGIIVLLAGLTLTVVSTLTAKAETGAAENTLKLLDMALTEWEEAASRQITFGDPSATLPGGQTPVYDLDSTQYATSDDSQQELLMSRTIGIISANPAANELLAKIDADYVSRVDETAPATGTRMKLVDPWGKSYRVVFPGRRIQSSIEPAQDDDGTIRTDVEKLLGICVQSKIAFVSAGPDGDFGDLDLAGPATPSPTPAAADNIYSYNLKKTLDPP